MTEKRNFKRYAKDSDFYLEYHGKPLKAKMIDYSLDGLGLSLKGSPPLKKGENVNVSGKSPRLIQAVRSCGYIEKAVQNKKQGSKKPDP